MIIGNRRKAWLWLGPSIWLSATFGSVALHAAVAPNIRSVTLRPEGPISDTNTVSLHPNQEAQYTVDVARSGTVNGRGYTYEQSELTRRATNMDGFLWTVTSTEMPPANAIAIRWVGNIVNTEWLSAFSDFRMDCSWISGTSGSGSGTGSGTGTGGGIPRILGWALGYATAIGEALVVNVSPSAKACLGNPSLTFNAKLTYDGVDKAVNCNWTIQPENRGEFTTSVNGQSSATVTALETGVMTIHATTSKGVPPASGSKAVTVYRVQLSPSSIIRCSKDEEIVTISVVDSYLGSGGITWSGTSGMNVISSGNSELKFKPSGSDPAKYTVRATSTEYTSCFAETEVRVFKVEVENIAFNYDSSSHAQDGLNIREDYNTAISIPEYVKSGQNKPAAYVKNTSARIMVRLTVKPDDGDFEITSVRIKGTADENNDSFGNVALRSVTFDGGVSQSGLPNDPNTSINEAEYIEFTVSGNMPDHIWRSEEAWDWIVTEVNSISISDSRVDRTSGHVVYTVLAAPTTAPWNQTPNDPCNPWSKALDLVCRFDWTGASSTGSDAVSWIVMEQYQSGFYPVPPLLPTTRRQFDAEGNLKLGELLAYSMTGLMNCEDVAAIITSLGNVVGCANGGVKLSRPVLPFKSNRVWPLNGTLGPTDDDISYHHVTTGDDGFFDATYGFEDTGLPEPAPNIWATGISLADYLDLLVPANQTRPSPGSTWHPSIR